MVRKSRVSKGIAAGVFAVLLLGLAPSPAHAWHRGPRVGVSGHFFRPHGHFFVRHHFFAPVFPRPFFFRHHRAVRVFVPFPFPHHVIRRVPVWPSCYPY